MKNYRTHMSYEVSSRISEMGFPLEFANLVGEQLNTDFTARQMLGYLRDAQPRTVEEIADEMLGILDFRDRFMHKKILERSR